jgi:16S rRNA (cytosine967-C5)-methyltransferase
MTASPWRAEPSALVDRAAAAGRPALEQILKANNRPGPMTLRVNTHRISRGPLRELLAAAHIDAEPIGKRGLLDRPHPVQAIPGFQRACGRSGRRWRPARC